jgi:hypothetical protein
LVLIAPVVTADRTSVDRLSPVPEFEAAAEESLKAAGLPPGSDIRRVVARSRISA